MSPTLFPELRKRQCSEIGTVQNLGTLPYSRIWTWNSQSHGILDSDTKAVLVQGAKLRVWLCKTTRHTSCTSLHHSKECL